MTPKAVGKKARLYIGKAGAGQRSVILLKIIEACRSKSVDAWEYLSEVHTRPPTLTDQRIEEVSPGSMVEKKSHPSPPPRPAAQPQIKQ